MSLYFSSLALLISFLPGATGGDSKTREFLFRYEATVTGLAPGKSARIWIPVPPTNEDQQIALVTQRLPRDLRIGTEPKYGNQVLFTESEASRDGTATIALAYRVVRQEVRAVNEDDSQEKLNIETFLQPDSKVPVGGKSLALLENRELPRDQLALGRVLYDVVNGHMRYSKDGVGWGSGDADWACDSGYGNCSDFHSVFISLARSQKLPAKFEIGFALPEKRGKGDIAGYHCWAKFRPKGRGWVPVDISEANKNPQLREYYFGNLTEDRVTFSVGRDITLVPPQQGPPLNFFIYPYVEVDGEPYPNDRVERRFSFEDLN